MKRRNGNIVKLLVNTNRLIKNTRGKFVFYTPHFLKNFDRISSLLQISIPKLFSKYKIEVKQSKKIWIKIKKKSTETHLI